MSMQTDVKNVHANASGLLVSGRVRVKGLVITSTGAGAGTVQLKDGGSGGTVTIEVDAPSTAAFHNVLIPGEGVLFETDVYATLTNAYVSVFYG
ncbi:MAG: hypothetical protein RL563_2151 [Pseudomonadota bacterium]|jgi:hypothetical protein